MKTTMITQIACTTLIGLGFVACDASEVETHIKAEEEEDVASIDGSDDELDVSNLDDDHSVYIEGEADTSYPEMGFIVSIVGSEDEIDVSISDADFARIAKEYGLPLQADLDVAYGTNTPRLSSACSISSPVTSSGATWSTSATRLPSCFGYARFSGDNEDDCYIKFNNYTKKPSYLFNDVNLCANAAATYYNDNLAAYYDSNANVYLRLDRRWCALSNCEDGFTLK